MYSFRWDVIQELDRPLKYPSSFTIHSPRVNILYPMIINSFSVISEQVKSVLIRCEISLVINYVHQMSPICNFDIVLIVLLASF